MLRRFYTRWLMLAELALVTGLAVTVVLGALLVAMSGWVDPRPLTRLVGIDDLSLLQTLVYNLTLLLCLFGAVIAARRASHIAVDAVTPHLRPAVRLRVEGAMSVVAGIVALWVAQTGYDYITQFIGAEDRIVVGQGGFYSKKVWRWPLVIAFGWMALHFFVTGVVRLAGKSLQDAGLLAQASAQPSTEQAPPVTGSPAP